MQPTFNPDTSAWNDVIIFDRFSVNSGKPILRGDIVSLRDPIRYKRTIVKRVVAVSGDVVKTLPPYLQPEVLVPEGHIWVEGDEPFHSLDSNSFGPIPLALVDAKLRYIVWPLHRLGSLRRPETIARERQQQSRVTKVASTSCRNSGVTQSSDT